MEVKPGYSCPDGYKQTEVGVIPEEWEVAIFGDMVDYTKGYAFKSSEYKSDGVRIVRVSDTTYDSILEADPVFMAQTKASLYTKWRLREHDLVISTVGSKPPMYDSMVGKVILIQKSHEGALLNQNAILIRNKKRRAHIQRLFLDHFRMKRYLVFIEGIFRGNANQASITLKDLFQFGIPLPSDDTEQRAIASALSDVDALIGALDRLIAKNCDLKQAAMQQLLTGRQRLPSFHEKWREVPFKYIYDDIFKKSPISSSDGAKDGAFSLFVSGGEVKRIERALYSNTEALIFSDGGVFDVRYFAGDFSVTDHCYVVSICGDMRFYFYWLSLHKSKLDSLTFKGSGLRNLDKTALGNIKVPLPHESEQTAIAAVLSDMDDTIAALEARRDKTRLLKQGMMQELLTGRTRLV